MTLRRGFELCAGEPVVVVEDVITTGGSTLEVLDCVRALGAQVLAVGSLVDRSGGEVDLGLPRASLLQLQVEAWEAAACPLCAQGSRPEKPGSRATVAASR
jgi:orotate phosphoribosyltransferase